MAPALLVLQEAPRGIEDETQPVWANGCWVSWSVD